MGARAEAVAFIKAQGSQFKRELRRLQRDTADFRRGVNRELRHIAVGAAAAAVAIGVIGSDFETSMAKVQGVSNATATEMVKLETVARKMGSATAFSASQAAGSQEDLLRAGLGVRGAIEALPGVMNLAGAAVVDLSTSAELTAATLNIFDRDVSTTADTVNTLFASTTQSKLGIETLATGLANAGPAAAAFNLGLEESLTVLGKLTDITQDAGKAGTFFKTTLVTLTDAARTGKGEIGEALKEWDVRTQGITGAIELLEAAGIDGATAMAEFGAKAGPGLTILLSSGSKALREMQAAITGTSAAYDAYATQMATTEGRVKVFLSTVQEAALRVWEVMRGPVNEGITALTTAVQENFETIKKAAILVMKGVQEFGEAVKAVTGFLWKHRDAVEALGIGLGVTIVIIYAAAAAQWALNIAMSSNPIGLIITAIGLLVSAIAFAIDKTVGWKRAWIELKFVLQANAALLKLVGRTFVALHETIQLAMRLAFDVISGWVQAVAEVFQPFFDAIKRGGQVFVDLYETAKEWLGKAFGAIVDFVEDTADLTEGIGLFDGLRESVENGLERIQGLTEDYDFSGIWSGLTDEFREEMARIKEEKAVALAELEFVGPLPPGGMMPDGAGGEDFAGPPISAMNQLGDEAEQVATRIETAFVGAYDTIVKEASNAASAEGVLRLKVGRLLRQAAKEEIATQIELGGRLAAQRAAMHAAAAYGALAVGDLRGAGLHTLSALGYGAVAGGAALAAGALRSSEARHFNHSSAIDEVSDSDGRAIGDRGPRRSSFDLTGRTAPENVTNNLFVNIGGSLVGDGGIEELAERLRPHIGGFFSDQALRTT